MAVFRIPDEHLFPNPRLADPSGLLGVGGDLNPGRILLAYRMGIFLGFRRVSPSCGGHPIREWSWNQAPFTCHEASPNAFVDGTFE